MLSWFLFQCARYEIFSKNSPLGSICRMIFMLAHGFAAKPDTLQANIIARVREAGGETACKIPVTREMTPNFYVHATLFATLAWLPYAYCRRHFWQQHLGRFRCGVIGFLCDVPFEIRKKPTNANCPLPLCALMDKNHNLCLQWEWQFPRRREPVRGIRLIAL